MKGTHDQKHTPATESVDLRNSMDFFCMLKACALIRKLAEGESVLIRTNDNTFLADLRRVHPDCAFTLESQIMGFERDAEYFIRVTKTPTEQKTSTPEDNMPTINVTCPNCQADVTIAEPEDYAPQFQICRSCERRFIVEKRENGVKVMTEKGAPCMSNPNCREVETSGCCED